MRKREEREIQKMSPWSHKTSAGRGGKGVRGELAVDDSASEDGGELWGHLVWKDREWNGWTRRTAIVARRPLRCVRGRIPVVKSFHCCL